MAATKLGIYNDACRAIGDIRLATLTDDVEARYALDDAWDDAVEFVFTEGLWNFAIKTVKISYNSGLTPIPGFSFAFDKPNGWMRTITISTTSLFDIEANYRDEGGKLYANFEDLYIRYLSSALANDSGIASWPPAFARTVAAYLAMECAERISGSAEKKAQLSDVYKDTLQSAKNKDALDQPKIYPRPGSWLRGMRGSVQTRDRGPLSGY